jgi:hypothetical protein
MFPVEVPDTEVELDDHPLDEPAETGEDDADLREAD